MPFPKDPVKAAIARKRMSDAQINYLKNHPEVLNKRKEKLKQCREDLGYKGIMEKYWGDPIHKDEARKRRKEYFDNPENIKKYNEIMEKTRGKEEYHLIMKQSQKQRFKNNPVNETTRKKMSISAKKRFEKQEERDRVGEFHKKRFSNPENKKKHIEILKKINGTPEARKRNSERITNYFKDPKSHEYASKAQRKAYLDRAWYGNVSYKQGKIYCEKWTKDLIRRIREYWGNKSVLSGKTKEYNNNRLLSCHHVYYQEKACCVWDEDAQGYYAWIDIGTSRKPNKIKYYIKGDPNKFVSLTSHEHGQMQKNKLEWIKIFEDLIENQGGKCYFTKEEWVKLQKHNL